MKTFCTIIILLLCTLGVEGAETQTNRRRSKQPYSALRMLDLRDALRSSLSSQSKITRPILPGSPLVGLTPAEFERFRLGREDFLEVETAEEGLGPTYNGTSCGSCHSVPALGGTAAISTMRAGYRDEEGNFIALNGGTLYHLFSTPPHRVQVMIPPEANVIDRRVPIPLFGGGLVEAIPDATIIALEDPEDLNKDGISGRAARIIDVGDHLPRIGRFGWKAQHGTLLAFGADAYLNEMGITNDLFPNEMALGVDPAELELADPRPALEDEPEQTTGLRGIDNFESFMKFLAPLERGPVTPSVVRGDQIFKTIGCPACHVPRLMTGPSENPLFDRKAVNLFSDLLLHDVGTGDGIAQEAALPNEIRTPPLWGLRFRRPLLHNGTAPTVEDAIRQHQGEASFSIRLFSELTPEQKNDLLTFLSSL